MSVEGRDQFPGSIGTTVDESTPWWPPQAMPGRPNVVVVILDDTGWSDFGCFGSEIDTPVLDGLAANGVRFRNFHVAALCSPTRASLLTGRNHHSVGMRFLADTDTGFPNSRGAIRADVPTLPQILREHGYGTYLAGKWHLAPLHEVTPAGPFTNWPLAKGFDRYYGFLDGCTDQYEPELYRDNSPVQPPRREGYHLTEDLVDEGIGFIRDHLAFRPDEPFYLQLALGATHAPFQVPPEYVAKYEDAFADGWDVVRERRLARQQELGVVPQGTELTERPGNVPAWDDLDDEQRLLYSRLQATFAGFLDHTDVQLGRLVDALRDQRRLDDTIILVFSDNGASREGGPNGEVDTNAGYGGAARPVHEQVRLLDGLGGPDRGAHYPEGWATAGNTPFRFWKQFVDLGGVRSPLIVSWANPRIEAAAVRTDFVHVIDIAPTLLDLLGIDAADQMHGRSVASALEPASPPTGRDTQYWETLGHRAIWHDGWKAVTAHHPGDGYDADRWRLYRTADDFSESIDLADQYPEKVAELERLWWEQARTNDVLPLDDRTLKALLRLHSPLGLFSRSALRLLPEQGLIPFPSGVTGTNRSMRATASFRPGEAPDGVVLASGNRAGGYLLHVQGSSLVFEHSYLGRHEVIEAPFDPARRPLALAVDIEVRDDLSALVLLLQDDDVIGTGTVDRTSAHLSFVGLDVGRLRRTTFSTRVRPGDRSSALVEVLVEPRTTDQDVAEYAEAVMSGE